jgi:hypothetical protein
MNMFWRVFYSRSAILFLRHPFLRRKVAKFGEIAAWVYEMTKLDSTFKLVKTREEIWKEIIVNLKGDYRLFEFGVAQGDGIRWWLSNSTSSLVSLDGFDRFTGLPLDWRHLKAGSFDNGGKPPQDIRDDRVTWHIGDIEHTLPNFLDGSIPRDRRVQLIFLFDMDLGSPSLAALSFILDFLQPGDIVYFDESYDLREEGLAFLELTKLRSCKIIAGNFEGIALELLK